ncbi:MAG: hypothetical protein WDZ26_06815 [Nitriliruptoraceae bacterium]
MEHALGFDLPVDDAMQVVPRMWDRDHTVWRPNPTEISDRLGWLDAPERADAELPAMRALVEGLRDQGATTTVLVGMGGSSMYPELLSTIGPLGQQLHVHDTTDPAAVLALEQRVDWEHTVLVPASKSGGTIETVCGLARFRARLLDVHGERAGDWIVPITDPGSALDDRAATERWGGVVHGQADVGGRFSALTAFGLFPALLAGIDADGHLESARTMLSAARSTDPAVNEPALLGAILATAARIGRDKLTLLLPDEVSVLGDWIEQLVAESTGKDGIGLIPVLGETPDNAAFGDDRLVVCLGDHPAADAAADVAPIVRIPWSGVDQLAAEVVRWEVGTAVAGALLRISPFDQPDVARAKDATARVLADGTDLPEPGSAQPVLDRLRRGDHIGLLGFVTPGGDDEVAMRAAADRLRARHEVPVTIGIGPRYLHSTGQLHKGGADRGVFLLTVGDDPVDADIPGRDLTFSRLKRAQAAGDLAALTDVGRRVALVHTIG